MNLFFEKIVMKYEIKRYINLICVFLIFYGLSVILFYCCMERIVCLYTKFHVFLPHSFIFHLSVLPFFLIPLLSLLPKKIASPSDLFLWILYLFVVPSAMIFLMPNLGILGFFKSALVGSIYCSFVILLVILRLKNISLPSSPLTSNQFVFLITSFLILIFFFSIIILGLPEKIPYFYEVYETRIRFRELRNFNNQIVFNLLAWGSWVLAPFMLNFGYKIKSRVLMFLSMLFILYSYGLSGHKAYIIFSMFSFSIFYFLSVSKKSFLEPRTPIRFFSFILIFSMGVSFFGYDFFNKTMQRIFLTPGINTNLCFKFFSTHPKIAFSDAPILKFFLQHPYEKTIGYTLGTYYYKNLETNANVSYIGDAFANAGILGVIFISILLGFFLWIIDSLSNGKDKKLIASLLLIQAVALSETGLQQSLIGTGFLLLILLIYFLPNEEKKLPS